MHLHTYMYNGLLLSYKKNEIFPFATTWMDQEDFMLRETNQIKTNTIQFHLYIKPKKQYMEQRKQYIKRTNWWSLENPGVAGLDEVGEAD